MLPRVIAVAAFLALIVGVAGCGGDGLYHFRLGGDESNAAISMSEPEIVTIAKPEWWDDPAVLYCDDPKVGAADYAGGWTTMNTVEALEGDGSGVFLNRPEVYSTVQLACRISGP